MLTLFIVTVISFVLMKISPIDPAVAQAQRLMNATPEYIAQLRVRLAAQKLPVTTKFVVRRDYDMQNQNA